MADREAMMQRLAEAKANAQRTKRVASPGLGMPDLAPDEEMLRLPPRELRAQGIGQDQPATLMEKLANLIAGGQSRSSGTMARPLAEAITGTGYGQFDAGSATLPNAKGERSMGAIDVVPGVSEAISLLEGSEAAQKGDWTGAALGIAGGAMPPGAGKAGKGGVKLAEKALAKGGRGALTEAMTKKGKEAITAVSLRKMPLDEAIASAKTGRHIIPKPEGGFVGAPYSAQTKRDLAVIRKKFDADVAAGAAGADWYPRAQEWIKQMAGSDPVRQSEMARNLALFSAQADPGGNLGFSVKARNNAIMGMTPTSSEGKEGVVRTGQQWRTYKDAYDTGDDIELGPKTGIYSDHMDPTRTSPTTGTNDIWHARALGFTTPEGEPWSRELSPQQHAWMDAETVLAVDRANKAGVGGRTNWSPGEVQAAPWVAGKGRGLEQSRNMTPEQGLAEASKTYPDYAPQFTGYGTHEMTPGSTTGHLPEIAKSAASKDAYASEAGSWWQQPGTGRDTLYDAQGAYVGPSNKTVGIYDEPGGERVVGPAQTATPLIAHSGPTGERVVDPASKQMMTGTEGFRAMMDAQDAGAWSAQIPGQKMSHMNAFEVPLGAGQQDREALSLLMSKAQGAGQPGVIHQGPQALVTDFGDPGLKSRGVKDVQAALPGARPVRREGDLIEYGKEWQQGEGSDAVTTKMLAGLNPAQEAAFSKPEVRAQVLAKMQRDELVAARSGQPVRKDLQTARKIFAEGGIPALKAAIGKGLLPVAALGVFVQSMSEPGGGDQTGGAL